MQSYIIQYVIISLRICKYENQNIMHTVKFVLTALVCVCVFVCHFCLYMSLFLYSSLGHWSSISFHLALSMCFLSLLQAMVETVNNLLCGRAQPAWKALSVIDQLRCATMLLDTVEMAAFMLADNLLKTDTIQENTDNIRMSISPHTLVYTTATENTCFELAGRFKALIPFIPHLYWILESD